MTTRPPAKDGPIAQWYVANPATLADVERSADMARVNAGQRAFIHHHAEGATCTPDCRERLPLFGGVL